MGEDYQNDDDGVKDKDNEDIDHDSDNASQTEVLDAQGLYDWEKVEALVRALIGLRGLNVSNEEAKIIQELYSKLDEYDQSPLTFTSPRPTPSRGRFGRCKKSQITIEQMKRYMTYAARVSLVILYKRCFLSGGCPACLPNKCRVVEAICILLWNKFPNAFPVCYQCITLNHFK